MAENKPLRVADDLIPASLVLLRGWTNRLIGKFLGEPDKLATNPVYRSGAPVRLYSRRRVEAAEQTPEFHAEKEKSDKRSAISKTASMKKREETIEITQNSKIQIRVLEVGELIDRACTYYNNRTRKDYYATEASDKIFLDRIVVNYIRHVLTTYDGRLSSVYGRVGVREAEHIIREKTYRAISAAYPMYDEECRRQASVRGVSLMDEV